MALSLKEVHRCTPKNEVLVTDEIRGEIFCEHCGLVMSEKISSNNHAGNRYTKEDYLKNTTSEGASKLYYSDYGISTQISNSTTDSVGKKLSGQAKRKFNRLRIWDKRAKRQNRERSLLRAFVLLDRMKSKLGLSDVICEKAAYYYRKAGELNAIRGHSIPATLSATIYLSCRENGSPRTLDDIAKTANIKRKTLSRTSRHIIKTLDIEANPQDPIFFVNKIASSFDIQEKTKRLAINFLEKAKTKRITEGKRPGGMVSAAIYLAAAINNESVTYTSLEKISHTSSVTIRKRVNQLKKELKSIPEFARIIP